MKNQQLRKLFKTKKNDYGFTLTELLIGLFMSLFVTGALGFGLYQILRTTSKESSKISARNEATRAVEFISDEIRRARSIDTNASNANNSVFNSSGKTVVLALEIPEISSDQNVDNDLDADNSDAGMLGSDNVDSTSERIVYYLESSSGTNWQGPQVLYRWGPPLNANGDYTQNGWQYEALIDGIDDTAITADPCNGDTLTPSSGAAGFYACINATSNAAQIFLTGGVDTTTGDDTNYTADTKAVARAKDATVNNVEASEVFPTNFKTLGAIYNCKSENISGTLVGTPWKMRMDFGNNPSDSDDTTVWIHDPNRQAQPIDISTDNDLTITASPIDATGCNSKGNEGTNGTEALSSYSHKVAHTIKFMKDSGNPDYDSDAWKTFNGDNTAGTHDVPDVKGDGTVMVYKNGSIIPADFFDGYDFDGDGNSEQKSLGKFLLNADGELEQAYAEYANGSDATGGYRIIGLEDNERIIAFEVGHTDQAQPGFDVQDAVFIMTNDEFAKKY